MALSDLLLKHVDRKTVSRNSNIHRYFQRRGVSKSSEFLRIDQIPRRVWDGDPDEVAQVVEFMTNLLKKPEGEMRLWPQQAVALAELKIYKGIFAPLNVGDGKALLSILAPMVLDAERPILLVPADLREQTKRKVLPQMRQHWKLHPRLRVIGYSELSLAKNANMLEKLQPDVIILDEAHSVKSPKAARTKRLIRYMRELPETIVVPMSGTMASKSIRDYAHISRWGLKDVLCPLPIKWQELQDWADAIDERLPNERMRMAPGALEKWIEEEDKEPSIGITTRSVRKAFRRRLVQTPGVICTTTEDRVGASLVIRRAKTPNKVPNTIWQLANRLRTQWETPNGDVCMEAVEVWRHMRELALGFWYRWDPAAPRQWMDARKAWKSYVRDTLKHNRRKLDTELQVWNECDRSDSPPQCWLDWNAIKNTFKPNSVAQWVDEFALNACADWMNKNDGIVWVEHTAFGERLAQKMGRPYFGAGKKASLEILDARGPIIASVHAHGQGKNLQHYSKNLVASPSPSGKTWEQMVGRTHRFGQEADEVEFDVFQHMQELEDSFKQARADARYLEDTLGGKQKLNYADFVGIADG